MQPSATTTDSLHPENSAVDFDADKLQSFVEALADFAADLFLAGKLPAELDILLDK